MKCTGESVPKELAEAVFGTVENDLRKIIGLSK